MTLQVTFYPGWGLMERQNGTGLPSRKAGWMMPGVISLPGLAPHFARVGHKKPRGCKAATVVLASFLGAPETQCLQGSDLF